MKKVNTLSTLCLLVFAFLSVNAFAEADCQLSCNNDVQVSLDGACELVVTYDMMLEDGDNPATCNPNGRQAFWVEIMDQWCNPINGTNTLSRDELLQYGMCGQVYCVMVKHIATNNVCWGTIIVEDKIPPTAYDYEGYLYCTEDPPPAYSLAELIEYGRVDDNCYLELVSVEEQKIAGTCYIEGFERIYTVSDLCGNLAQCYETFYWLEQEIEFPEDVWFYCHDPNASTDPLVTGKPQVGGHDLQVGKPTKYCDYTVSYEDWEIPICHKAGTVEIIRTWKAVSSCGHGPVYVAKQSIKILDKLVIECPKNTDLYTNLKDDCGYYGPLPAPTASWNCTDWLKWSATVYIAVPNANGYGRGAVVADIVHHDDNSVYLPMAHTCETYFLVVYEAVNDCYTQADPIACLIHLEDNDNPTAIAKNNITLDISGHIDNPDECKASLTVYDLDNGSYDNCKLEKLGVYRPINEKDLNELDNAEFGHAVWFDYNDACSVVPVVLRAYDCQGNYSQVWVNVEVQDVNLKVDEPRDKEVSCEYIHDYASFFDTPRAWGCTAEQTGVETTPLTEGQCGEGSVTRTWTFTNCKGFVKSVDQTITFFFSGKFSVVCPADVTYNCEDGLSQDDLGPSVTGKPDITEYGCDVTAVSYDDEVFYHDLHTLDEGCFKIRREWEIISWCTGDYYECTQYIKVIDTEAPVVTAPDYEEVCVISDACTASFTILPPTATDCSIPDGTDLCKDKYTEVHWTFAGHYGDSGEGYVSCGATVTFGPGVLTLTYKVEDPCGNTGKATTEVWITDCEAPVIKCTSFLSGNIDIDADGDGVADDSAYEIWATDFLEDVYDNCDSYGDITIGMRRAGTDDPCTPSITVSCDEFLDSGGLLNVEICATDWAGNVGVCLGSVIISDSDTEKLAGCAKGVAVAALVTSVENEGGEMVENTSITVNGDMGILNYVTGPNGQALFANIPMHENVSISAAKNLELLNGVTTYDIVILQRHILGLEPLNSPYKLIAADVNNSGSISTSDIVALRKAILAISNEFPNNKSWRFVDGAHTFDNPASPWGFPEVIDIDNISNNTETDFIGVKVGDLNESAAPNQLLGEESLVNEMVISATDMAIKAGNSYTVELQAKDFNFYGFQFTLNIADAEITSVNAGSLDISEGNFGLQLASQGTITSSWSNSEIVTLEDEAVLFTVTFNATANGKLSDVMSITSQSTTAEAVNGNLAPVGITLAYNNAPSVGFEVFQNTPNPFSTETKIGFTLPTADQVKFTVFDVAGKVVMYRESDMATGYNEFTVSRSDLGSAGVLYYTIETSSDVATKKMITIEQ